MRRHLAEYLVLVLELGTGLRRYRGIDRSIEEEMHTWNVLISTFCTHTIS